MNKLSIQWHKKEGYSCCPNWKSISKHFLDYMLMHATAGPDYYTWYMLGI